MTDLDFGDIKSYSKMLNDFKHIKDRLVNELSNKLFRQEHPNIVYNQDIMSSDSLKTLKRLSAKEFIERSKKYFCHLYNPKGILGEAQKELDKELDLDLNNSSGSINSTEFSRTQTLRSVSFK